MLSLDYVRQEIIGQDTHFLTPFGLRRMTYADYTASGRTLKFIEQYLQEIQKYYANTHTEDSFSGLTMSHFITQAEQMIKRCLHANQDYYLIPVGTGSTGAIAKLAEILGLYLNPSLKANFQNMLQDERNSIDIIKELLMEKDRERPVVFLTPYEHHSNYLIWQECLVDCVEIKLTDEGELDQNDLITQLSEPKYQNRLKICSFSACSNITGLMTDVYNVARIVHAHGGLIFYDFAASGPYVEIDVCRDDTAYFDAIFLSPHKFIGGPGATGLLLFHKKLYNALYPPTISGGGTVSYVSPYFYDYATEVEMREKAGTPGILQILKAALAFEVKEAIGTKTIMTIEHYYTKKVFDTLLCHPNIEILGAKDPKKRLSIFSFNIKHEDQYLHHKFVSTLLNDLFGIQSRAGCACAGPYGHRLLGIDQQLAYQYRKLVLKGFSCLKPGFVRVNFHYLMTETEVDFILSAILFIANFGYLFLSDYALDVHTGAWRHLHFEPKIPAFGLYYSLNEKPKSKPKQIDPELYQTYLQEAYKLARLRHQGYKPHFSCFDDPTIESLRWFPFIHIVE